MSAPIGRDCQIMSFVASQYRCGSTCAPAVTSFQFCILGKNSALLWYDQPYGYSCASADDRLNSDAALWDGGLFLARVRGDVYVASLRRLSVVVALSSPQADTQILSRNSLAQCLMVHQYQVQCDAQTPVCAPSSQLLSTVTGPSVTKCCAVTPVLEHYPQHIYDLNEPTSFLLSINNWTATEGAFSTAIWRGTRVAEFTQQVKMHSGKLCHDWIQLQLLKRMQKQAYPCFILWAGRAFFFLMFFFFCLFWHLFRALIHKICFWAARDIQKHSEYMVSAVSIRSSFSPHLHL